MAVLRKLRLVRPLDGDDAEFCEFAEPVLLGAIARSKPEEVIVVRIDRWFSQQWLGFKCKQLGAFGVQVVREHARTPLPPFVPNRVRSQRRFRYDGGELREIDAGPALHTRQSSSANEKRWISRLLPQRTLLAWVSGGSRESGRGAMMVYAWDPPRQLAFWYAGASRLDQKPTRDPASPAWSWVQTANVSRTELAAWARAMPADGSA